MKHRGHHEWTVYIKSKQKPKEYSIEHVVLKMRATGNVTGQNYIQFKFFQPRLIPNFRCLVGLTHK